MSYDTKHCYIARDDCAHVVAKLSVVYQPWWPRFALLTFAGWMLRGWSVEKVRVKEFNSVEKVPCLLAHLCYHTGHPAALGGTHGSSSYGLQLS